MHDVIHWGILGTGTIANKFAAGLAVLPEARLIAVGSRSQSAADVFGEAFQVPRRHASYEALANDPEVDVIYVATPHSCHRDNSLLCLAAGKAVLCEKPFAINARQAEEVIRFARTQKLFLMEAMWTRFFPLLARVRDLVKTGALGEVRMLSADFGFRAEANKEGRLFDPSFGGGAMLDVGIYPLSLASMIFGAPTRIAGMAHLGETGVDEQSAMVLGYADGQSAFLSSAIRTETPQEAWLFGSLGQLKIHSPWWCPQAMTLTLAGEAPEIIESPMLGNGYTYEALAVMDCLRQGQLESAIMPLDETLAIMKTLDAWRTQVGLKYPMAET